MSERIRVLVVDDHAVVRGGLRLFLMAFPDLELVGEAANGEEAVRQCTAIHPDVVLMDLMMPVMNGVEATRAIRSASPAYPGDCSDQFPRGTTGQRCVRGRGDRLHVEECPGQ